MKAWILPKPGSIGDLQLADIPEPVAAPGEVVLRVGYAALNPADRYLAEDQYPARPSFPHILGRDAVGVVASIGPGVTAIRPGQRLAVLRGEAGVSRPGTFAELVAVPAENLVHVPDDWTDQQAAGATLVYLTAYQALTQWGELPPSVVLVSGASGGVGIASIQLAVSLGHTVIALSRGQAKVQVLRDMGAAAVFDPTNPQWRKQCKGFLGERRVDLAIDNVGGPVLPAVIDTLGMCGRVSVVGRLAGPVPEFNTASLLFRRIRIGGVAVGTYSNAESRQAWQAVLQLLARTGARPLVDRVFPFDQLPAAFSRLREGPLGKVLLAAPTGPGIQ